MTIQIGDRVFVAGGACGDVRGLVVRRNGEIEYLVAVPDRFVKGAVRLHKVWENEIKADPPPCDGEPKGAA